MSLVGGVPVDVGGRVRELPVLLYPGNIVRKDYKCCLGSMHASEDRIGFPGFHTLRSATM